MSLIKRGGVWWIDLVRRRMQEITRRLWPPQLPILIWREPQVNPTATGLDRVLQHLPALESPQASPRLASSLILSGSVKVNRRGRGVFKSASEN
jgi:hypothetical protein